MTREKEEYVEVTVKVPKRLIAFLEDQDYFGWKKEDFFTSAVHCKTDCEVNELDVDIVAELQRKYGLDFGFTLEVIKTLG